MDVSQAMTTKILMQNRLLTPDELSDEEGPHAHEKVMARAHERHGFQVLPRDLKNIMLKDTPKYDLNEDEKQNKLSFPLLEVELKPTLEVADQYLNAEILLQQGDQVARGCVVA